MSRLLHRSSFGIASFLPRDHHCHAHLLSPQKIISTTQYKRAHVRSCFRQQQLCRLYKLKNRESVFSPTSNCEKIISIQMSLVGTGMLNISLTLIACCCNKAKSRNVFTTYLSQYCRILKAERSVKDPKEETWHTAVRV